ncbi:hypothetical protein EAF00_001114 [Botryotinia globosa]|nr:hypothetical protein EAF00_001114 [Botryotinia globosa]
MARVIDIKLDPKDCVHNWGRIVESTSRISLGQPNRPDWGDDLDSAAVKYGLIMLLKARTSLTSVARYTSQSQLPLPHISVKNRTGLPHLAYALSMDGWALGDLVPDIVVLEELLIHGADPNEHVNSFHAIWEYVIYLVHVLVSKDNQEISSLSMKWVRVFELMLEHGANPYACCMENSDEFARFIGGLPNAIPTLPRSIAEHDLRGFLSATLRRGDTTMKCGMKTIPTHIIIACLPL